MYHGVLMLTEIQCGAFNRTGTLCGKCKDGHYPLAHSYDMNCVECPDGKSNWWKFVLAAFLPLTVFHFIVLFFKINVTSSHLHGFVLYSQGISFPAIARIVLLAFRKRRGIEMSLRYIGSFFGIWNLDFFRYIKLGICLPANTLLILALDIAVGMYPLLLMVLTYILIELHDRRIKPVVIIWKPFKVIFHLFHKNWEIKTSLIDAFATFLLLSSVKFLSVSYDLLASTKVYLLNSTSKSFNSSWRLSYNSTVPYFGEQHLPYAILAISVIVVLPAVLLLLYPLHCFQKFLNLFPVRWYILHTFMDSFHGCYKDGTQPGTRDCRWFASVFFMARIFCAIAGLPLFSISLFNHMATIVGVLIVIIIVAVQPFKTSVSHYSDVNAVFILLLAISAVSMFGFRSMKSSQLEPFYLGMIFSVCNLSLLFISTIILRWAYSHRKFGFQLIKRLCAWRHGYKTLEETL